MANKKGSRYPPRTLNDIVCGLKRHLEEVKGACAFNPLDYNDHSRSQRPRNFPSAPRIATSGQAQYRKSAIHGLPATLRMLRVKSDKSDWFWSQFVVFTKPFKPGNVGPGQRSRFLVLTKRSTASGILGDPRATSRGDIFGRKFTSRAEEPLGTYSHRTSSRRGRISSRWLGRKIFFCPISDEVYPGNFVAFLHEVDRLVAWPVQREDCCGEFQKKKDIQ